MEYIDFLNKIYNNKLPDGVCIKCGKPMLRVMSGTFGAERLVGYECLCGYKDPALVKYEAWQNSIWAKMLPFAVATTAACAMGIAWYVLIIK